MAHEIGVPTSPNNLVECIRVFLLAQGWTEDYFVTETQGRRLDMHKGSTYVHFHANTLQATGGQFFPDQTNGYAYNQPALGITMGTGIVTANEWWSQAGVPVNRAGNKYGGLIPLPAGACTSYQMFYHDDYKTFVLYVETTPDVWRWVAFGESIVKSGSWTGGMWFGSSTHYYYGQYGTESTNKPGEAYGGTSYLLGGHCVKNYASTAMPMLYIQADVDTSSGVWVAPQCANAGYGTADYQKLPLRLGCTNIVGGDYDFPTSVPNLAPLHARSRGALNAAAVLSPVQLFITRDDGGMTLLGHLPYVYATQVGGMVLGESYAFESDTFIPFTGPTGGVGIVIQT